MKQPTNFSMIPLRLKKKKKNFKNHPITKFGMPKKLMPKSEAKIKSPFLQYPFLIIF